MVTLLIIILLAIGFYSGYRRGFTLQIVYSIGYAAAFWVAQNYYKALAPNLELLIPYPSATPDTKLVFFDSEITFELDQAFYAACAFMILLFAGWLVTRFVAIFAHKLMFLPILKQANSLAGGILSVVIVYIGIFLVLSIVSMIPMTFIQNMLESSSLARFIVEQTPVLSKLIYDLWIESIIGS